MKVVIIKYNAGNIFSVTSALKRIGVEAVITDDKNIISSADKVIFPGVGEAGTTMRYLKAKNLDFFIKNLKQPVLGICLGMQLMCKKSEEGNVECLGIFDEDVQKFPAGSLKIPHMGWNNITKVKEPLFNKTLENEYVYFVHSYYVSLGTDTIASAEYILPFSAALNKNNFYATQFHPEKSGDAGERILKNFIYL
ncbi:Imidazole glycerol phosphate synthase, glutamine amidotransferase subunit [Elusimicrobium minutum Pei191]|uniref:Imidazole glycerol phosphate synthase subunit HisH n=1 Tax=Elusimicrobium minutum (strain Pei191) TaxID=445932 RepID=B2KEU9_ELUMP|nr:imidazole glycerol phosphate synthase subunit HisH [Elusimicrobium minutum]ACC99045.1 Imidazole glycerol phosphate synthase, glutamine amidotransferase subunit [Elusimicrobium minutum Pei191]